MSTLQQGTTVSVGVKSVLQDPDEDGVMDTVHLAVSVDADGDLMITMFPAETTDESETALLLALRASSKHSFSKEHIEAPKYIARYATADTLATDAVGLSFKNETSGFLTELIFKTFDGNEDSTRRGLIQLVRISVSLPNGPKIVKIDMLDGGGDERGGEDGASRFANALIDWAES